MNKRSGILITAVAVWDTVWKMAAIWTALKRRDFRWIAPLLVVNSAGILPLAYLKVFARDGADEVT